VKKEHIKDFYFYKAKREKYSARSVYKLKNIQDKYHLFSRGNRVLDLGAAPGSWSEYLIEELGRTGTLIALDQKPLSMTCLGKIEKVGIQFEFLQQSVFDDLPSKISQLDAVVSDLAPATQGTKLVDQAGSLALIARAYEIAEKHLKKGGHFVVKLFQSEDTVKLAKSWEKNFKLGKLYKPPATHKESKEIYFVGCHWQA
jgi:23S rRNA (uridine2552-2'-O)-methyltransferase